MRVRLDRPSFKVKVTSSPSGAAITVGGNAAGRTPATVSVPGYENVTVEVSRSGYASMSRKVYATRGGENIDFRLRQADFAGNVIVGCIDGGQRGIDFGRRVDRRDQSRIQIDAIARGRRRALVVHPVAQVTQVLAQVVDRDALHAAHSVRALRVRQGLRLGRCLEVGDAITQNRDEVDHDVRDRIFDAEQVGVQVALGQSEAQMTGETGI